MTKLRTCAECCYPYTGDACENPACDANPSIPESTKARWRADRERRAEEKAERTRLAEIRAHADAAPPVRQVNKELRLYKQQDAATKPGAICAFIRPAGFVLARVEEQRFNKSGMPGIARVFTLDALHEYHDRPEDEDPSSVATIATPTLQRAARRVVKAKLAPKEPMDKDGLQNLILAHRES